MKENDQKMEQKMKVKTEQIIRKSQKIQKEKSVKTQN
jgi:hypothetical protein